MIPYSDDSGSMVSLLIPCLAYGCFPAHRPSEGFSPGRLAGGSIGGGRFRVAAGLWRPVPRIGRLSAIGTAITSAVVEAQRDMSRRVSRGPATGGSCGRRRRAFQPVIVDGPAVSSAWPGGGCWFVGRPALGPRLASFRQLHIVASTRVFRSRCQALNPLGTYVEPRDSGLRSQLVSAASGGIEVLDSASHTWGLGMGQAVPVWIGDVLPRYVCLIRQ